MINLPHTLDLIDVGARVAGLETQYRWSGPASMFPPEDGKYIVSPTLPIKTTDPFGYPTKDEVNLVPVFGDRVMVLSRNDANMVRVIDSALDASQIESVSFLAGDFQEQVNSVFIQDHTEEGLQTATNYLVAIPRSASIEINPNNPATYRIVTRQLRFPKGDYFSLTLAAVDEHWINVIRDLTLTFLVSGAQRPEQLRGSHRARINCSVTQISRSLDNNYSERYYMVTNYIFNNSRRDIYMVPTPNYVSGLPDDVAGCKLERVQNFGSFSTITAQTYPTVTTDLALDFEEFVYSDIDGTSKTIAVPAVGER